MEEKKPVEIGLVVVSDTATHLDDWFGQGIIELCEKEGWKVLAYHIVPLDYQKIVTAITETIEYPGADIIFTAGGTASGLPDDLLRATEALCEDVRFDVLAHAVPKFRTGAFADIGYAGVAVEYKGTIIINLPDTIEAVKSGFPRLVSGYEWAKSREAELDD